MDLVPNGRANMDIAWFQTSESCNLGKAILNPLFAEGLFASKAIARLHDNWRRDFTKWPPETGIHGAISHVSLGEHWSHYPIEG